jgi:hypothetical protein
LALDTVGMDINVPNAKMAARDNTRFSNGLILSILKYFQ